MRAQATAIYLTLCALALTGLIQSFRMLYASRLRIDPPAPVPLVVVVSSPNNTTRRTITTTPEPTITTTPTPKDGLPLTRGGARVDEAELPSPLLVVFANAAYRALLGNFLCNAALFPGMHARTLFIVLDAETAAYIGALAPEAFVWLHVPPQPQHHAMEYSTPEYVRLMLLRGQLLLRLLGPQRVVVWTEADFEYHQDPLEHPQLAAEEEGGHDLMVMWDGGNYCGCLLRFAATDAARAFYAEGVVRAMEAGVARGDFTDDQVLLNRALEERGHTLSHARLDPCAFRHGRADNAETCAGRRMWMRHHNWVIGNARKEALARERNAWFIEDNDTEAPRKCRTRDLRVTVMTMDRPASLRRLLASLSAARYAPGMRVDLHVHVDRRQADAPHDAPTLAALEAFAWPHGVYTVRAWDRPMGLWGQWLEAWPCEAFAPDRYRAAVLLEDDLEVSPVYHEWFLAAHAAYGGHKDIGAITGMRAELVAQPDVVAPKPARALIPADAGAFAYRLIATWSLSPTHDAWRRFRAWARGSLDRSRDDPGLADTVPGQWFREFKARGTADGMWEIWYMRFMHDQGLYTVYPWREDGAAYVCNWREPGLHYSAGETGPDVALAERFDAPPPRLSLYAEWGLAFYACVTAPWPGLEASAQAARKRPLLVAAPEARCASFNDTAAVA